MKERFYGIPPNFELHEWAEAHTTRPRYSFWDPGCPLCVSALNRLMAIFGLEEGPYR